VELKTRNLESDSLIRKLGKTHLLNILRCLNWARESRHIGVASIVKQAPTTLLLSLTQPQPQLLTALTKQEVAERKTHPQDQQKVVRQPLAAMLLPIPMNVASATYATEEMCCTSGSAYQRQHQQYQRRR
jgi:hypothetical protein